MHVVYHFRGELCTRVLDRLKEELLVDLALDEVRAEFGIVL